MKLSVFTVCTPDYNLEETVVKLKELGYDAIEWRVSKALTEDPNPIPPQDKWYWNYNKSTVDLDTLEENGEYLKSLSDKYDLPIVSLATYLSVVEVEKVEMVLKVAAQIGAPRIRVQVPGTKGVGDYNALFDKTIQDIKVIEQLAKKFQVKVSFETHHGNLIPSASAAYRLVSNFDSKYIGVTYDVGNTVREGYESYNMAFQLLGEYLDHVHIKNARWFVSGLTEQGAQKWICEWVPIKAGQVDMAQVISELKAVGYDGYLSIEDFSNEQSTEVKLEECAQYLRDLLGE